MIVQRRYAPVQQNVLLQDIFEHIVGNFSARVLKRNLIALLELQANSGKPPKPSADAGEREGASSHALGVRTSALIV